MTIYYRHLSREGNQQANQTLNKEMISYQNFRDFETREKENPKQ